MANAGSIVASLILNADGFNAGIDAGIASAKKGSSSIGASLDRINQKQLNAASTNILKNFVSPAALAVGGAAMATNLIKGFSTGAYKDWNEAGKGLMAQLSAGIKSIPIVGTFYELGEAMGKAFFGVDAEVIALEKVEKKTKEIITLVKLLGDEKNRVATQEEALQARLDSQNKTANQIELDSIKAKGEAAQKVILDGLVAQRKAEIEAARIEKNTVYIKKYAGKEGIEGEDKRVTKTTKEQADEDFAALAKFKKLREEDAATAVQNQVAEAKNLQDKITANQTLKDLQKKTDDEKQAAANDLSAIQLKAHQVNMTAREVMLDNLKTAKGMTDEMKKQYVLAYDSIEAARISKELDTQRLDANNKVSKAVEDATAANDSVDDAKAKLEMAKQKAESGGATDVSTAIGGVKIQGSSDFSKNKAVQDAEEALAKAQETAKNTQLTYEALHDIANKLGGSP
tara:strand:+ start:2723 stop:4096 length:1374 start_codon:yes stop_codon:yes gene_type:complete